MVEINLFQVNAKLIYNRIPGLGQPLDLGLESGVLGL